VDTRYPSEGLIRIVMNPVQTKSFALKLRIPAWSSDTAVAVNGKSWAAKPGGDGYVAISREWHKSDIVELQLKLEPRVVEGDHLNQGKIAVIYGPLVLAADEALLGDNTMDLNAVGVAGSDLTALRVVTEEAPDKLKTWPGARVFRINAMVPANAQSSEIPKLRQIRMVPFADAGWTGTHYKVWLPVVR